MIDTDNIDYGKLFRALSSDYGPHPHTPAPTDENRNMRITIEVRKFGLWWKVKNKYGF